MSQLIKEYDENIGAWETFATTSANQSITVTINGAAVTIPGIGKLAQKGSNNALAVADGGTGATTPADARSNLGLGSSATADSQTSSTDRSPGRVLTVGAFGLGANTITPPADTYTGFFSQGIGGNANPDSVYGYAHLVMSVSGTYRTRMAQTYFGTPRLWLQNIDGSSYSTWAQVYTTANTTKASDGTLKAASPVARIVASQEACQRADIAEEGFSWCGCGTANAEAEGINISRLDVGVYVLTGSTGLASDGWQLLPPMDPGGMGELGVVEAEQTDNGELTIRLFKRKYMLNDEGEIVKTKGAAMDVPSNSWIDVRLDMPENSVWNQRQKAAVDAAENESGS
ncbi:TPA: hypothetical protein ACM21U_000499 [Enterobacter kobei]